MKRLRIARARLNDAEVADLAAYCARHDGASESDAIRRGLKLLFAADSPQIAAPAPPTKPAPRHRVRSVNDIGPDTMGAQTGALKR